MNKDNLSINTLRMLSVDMIEKANSGHPGLPLGAAPMLYTLFKEHLKFNPDEPEWINRDRFILSAGHGSALLYSLLHVFGYDLSIDDLKSFRQVGSKTPGHPEFGHTLGVDATTGPLGQGFTMAVGMALAEAHLRDVLTVDGYSPIDHYTYAMVGDGCLMEGISHEAASFAGSHGLGRLIVLYDSNNISIEGNTDITFQDDTLKRFEAYGWHTQLVEDGTDIISISKAIECAKHDDRPSIIEVKTVIGYGAGSVEGLAASHGAPIGKDNYTALKERLGWSYDAFTVPEEVRKNTDEILSAKRAVYDKEHEAFLEYKHNKKEAYLDYDHIMYACGYCIDLTGLLNAKDTDATRSSSGAVLQEAARLMPNLVGGSADLGPSNNSVIKDSGYMKKGDYKGRNIHFGVREFAMGAICNGMALHGGVKPFCATFFVFSDYIKPAMRLASLMKLPVIYILTHDSIGVGEDGPTHQPIEHLAMLRSLPDFSVIRPADYNETVYAWVAALRSEKPVALVLSRQKLPALHSEAEGVLKGAYIVSKEDDKLDATIVATGSEVNVAVKAKELLREKNIDTRVVSMPSWDLFDGQPCEYKHDIIPRDRLIVSVEALSTFGWDRYTKGGARIGIDHFGASGKGEELFKLFEITPEHIAEVVEKKLNK